MRTSKPIQIFGIIFAVFGLILASFARVYQDFSYTIRLLTLIIFSGTVTIYLIIRLISRKKMVKLPTKVMILVGLCILVILISLTFSPDFRFSLERVIRLITYIFIFFLVLDMFTIRGLRDSVIWGLIIGVGIFLFQAIAETYVAYENWFEAVGSYSIWPPFLYRFKSYPGHANIMMLMANQLIFFAIYQFVQAKNRKLQLEPNKLILL